MTDLPRSGSIALASLLVGDPIRLIEPVRSRDDLVRAVEPPLFPEGGLLSIRPGVALLHTLAASTAHLALRVVQLAPGSALLGEPSTELVVVLTAPLGESGSALRVVANLKACFRDATLMGRARGARTREDLVRILAPAEEARGEPLRALTRPAPGGRDQHAVEQRCTGAPRHHLLGPGRCGSGQASSRCGSQPARTGSPPSAQPEVPRTVHELLRRSPLDGRRHRVPRRDAGASLGHLRGHHRQWRVQLYPGISRGTRCPWRPPARSISARPP